MAWPTNSEEVRLVQNRTPLTASNNLMDVFTWLTNIQRLVVMLSEDRACFTPRALLKEFFHKGSSEFVLVLLFLGTRFQ
jgi:hypothetical protein